MVSVSSASAVARSGFAPAVRQAYSSTAARRAALNIAAWIAGRRGQPGALGEGASESRLRLFVALQPDGAQVRLGAGSRTSAPPVARSGPATTPRSAVSSGAKMSSRGCPGAHSRSRAAKMSMSAVNSGRAQASLLGK